MQVSSKEESMRGVIMVKPGVVEVRDVEMPRIIQPTDAIIKVTGTCICGSDLWPYRGAEPVDHAPMGHEYVGIVEEVGADVKTVKPGDPVVGSFCLSCGTCEICRAGFPSRCVNGEFKNASQAEYTRVALADGTLVKLPEVPTGDHLKSYLAASDVLGTGWFGAVAANVGPGKTVAVVGDGAVGLSAVLASKRLGAERIIAMSRHEKRSQLAREFGATDIIPERGEDGIEAVRELTHGLGAECVVEAVGNQASMNQAIGATRPGGYVGFVGVSHDVTLTGMDLFFKEIHLLGGPAPVRNYLPDLVDDIANDRYNPGAVFDATVPLDEAARGYDLMDRREATKVFLAV